MATAFKSETFKLEVERLSRRPHAEYGTFMYAIKSPIKNIEQYSGIAEGRQGDLLLWSPVLVGAIGRVVKVEVRTVQTEDERVFINLIDPDQAELDADVELAYKLKQKAAVGLVNMEQAQAQITSLLVEEMFSERKTKRRASLSVVREEQPQDDAAAKAEAEAKAEAAAKAAKQTNGQEEKPQDELVETGEGDENPL